MALTTLDEMEKQTAPTESKVLLLTTVGRCQMKLGRLDEAETTFQRGYEYNIQAIETHHSFLGNICPIFAILFCIWNVQNVYKNLRASTCLPDTCPLCS